MWTHLQPHLKSQLTSASIGKRARVEIFRSLNLRRLVAFTGSGTTSAFGLPAWDDLAKIFIEETNTSIRACLGPVHDGGAKQEERQALGAVEQEDLIAEISPLIEQVEKLLGVKDGKDSAGGDATGGGEIREIMIADQERLTLDDPTTVMDLCEEILQALPDAVGSGRSQLDLARHDFAQHFRQPNAGLVLSRLKSALIGGLSSEPGGSTGEGTDTGKGTDLTELLEASAWFGQETIPPENSPDLFPLGVKYCLSGKEPNTLSSALTKLCNRDQNSISDAVQNSSDMDQHFGPKLPLKSQANKKAVSRDIVDALVHTLRITRIATLNYDVQLERAILGRAGGIPGVDSDGFRDLCKDWQTTRPHTKRLEMNNALEKGAVSITLGPDNMGDIVNFAAYSRQYRHQILHLHGRFDDPQNLVVTKRDYERIYTRQAMPRQIFREAQEMLFGGNDVLLLGLGMNEEDVARPFRRLMARQDHERAKVRRIFLLKASSVCTKCLDNGECATCDRKDEETTLQNMIRYQIHTILFGGKVYRATMSALMRAGEVIVSKEKRPEDWKEALDRLARQLKEEPFSLDPPNEGNRLLLDREIDLLQEIASYSFSPTFKEPLKALLKEYEGRVMSRALVLELNSLKDDKGEWWDAWRLPPYERRAIYHQYVPKGQEGEFRNYLWLRHCPAQVPVSDGPASWGMLQEAKEEVDRLSREGRLARSNRRVRNSRILRLTAPRGGGKGSLMRLLMDAQAQEYVFSYPMYRAAFLAHQSFSMEFSSVAKALTRFFARQTAELLVEPLKFEEATGAGQQKVHDAVSKIHEELSGKAGAAIYRELAPADRNALGKDVLSSLQAKPPREPGDLDEAKLFEAAKRLYVSRREEEPRLVAQPGLSSASDLKPEVERPHRLAVLKEVMEALASATSGTGHRFFVSLSGLDRICDQHGDARNPMHRAMFRLLSGTTDREVPDPDPPIDYVFIAGRPQFPITFLSEQFEPTSDAPELATEHEKFYSRESRSGRILRKWCELTPLSWDERVRLSWPRAEDEAESDQKKAQAFLDWAKKQDASRQDNRMNEIRGTREIQQGLWKSVSLTVIVLMTWRRASKEKAESSGEETFAREFREFIEPLDRAFARDGPQGVLSHVLSIHENLDAREATTLLAGEWVDGLLMRLLLRHLVLFSLPVEIWVLKGCPLIQRHLQELYSQKDRKTDGHQAEHFRQRAFILNTLSWHLKELCQRGLVVEIEPSQNSAEGSARDQDPERRLHMRYALHARLREYFGYHMQLQISDEGDLNHHQMSVFCDQPRDLPSPRRQHFEMIEQIASYMIERCRVSLDTAYRTTWSGERYRKTWWDPRTSVGRDRKDKAVHIRAAEHLFFPGPTEVQRPKDPFRKVNADDADDPENEHLQPNGIAGAMGQIHATPQRLRACFSLLQTTLTVGSLSRLDSVELKPGGDPPFEVYRGWLRGLLNAAAGLERTREEISLLLHQSLFTRDIEREDERVGDTYDEPEMNALEMRIAATPSEDARLKSQREKRLETVKESMNSVLTRAYSEGLRRRQTTTYSTLRHPFYRDEIAWLYNERGLASFMQGRLFDAIPLFKQAKFIMAHAQTPPFDTKAYNAAERRINLNLAIAYIDRGKVDEARQLLSDLEISLRHVKGSTPSKVHGFAQGYLAYCDHLGGSFERALRAYQACLSKYVKHRDLRATSIFNRLLGELYLRIEQDGDAKSRLELAVNSASQAEQRDAENHALLSLAALEIKTGNIDAAQGRIRRVMHYASQMGLYRLEADAHLADGRLKLARGELGLAAEAVSRSVAMCARHGLRLRKLSGLVAYGQIQFHRSEFSFARSVLEEAKSECEALGFQLDAAAAANTLALISSQKADEA